MPRRYLVYPLDKVKKTRRVGNEEVQEIILRKRLAKKKWDRQVDKERSTGYKREV